MYVFYAPDLGDVVQVTLDKRRVATMVFDGETLHDLRGRVPAKVVDAAVALQTWHIDDQAVRVRG